MIYIDASRYSADGKRTGVENYSYFLINEMVSRYSKDITLICPNEIDLDVNQRNIYFPRLWTQLRLSWEVFRDKAIKTLFIPSHVMPIIHPKKTVITIHDVAFKRHPEAYGLLSRWYLNWATQFAVRHAYKMIVPSEITKNDLIKFYKANEKKIEVIPLGFANPKSKIQNPKSKILEKYGLEEKKYFLFLGRIETKKNIKVLVEAFAEFSKKYPDYKLVLAGKPGVGYEEIMSIVKGQMSAVIVTGYISEEEKWALLKKAACFVFPSLFEGFGLPLLEAMAMKTPIICSNIPSSKEVMGNLPVYFDADNAEELAHRMGEVVRAPELMERLVASYSERLAQFTWPKCAEETWRVLCPEKI